MDKEGGSGESVVGSNQTEYAVSFFSEEGKFWVPGSHFFFGNDPYLIAAFYAEAMYGVFKRKRKVFGKTLRKWKDGATIEIGIAAANELDKHPMTTLIWKELPVPYVRIKVKIATMFMPVVEESTIDNRKSKID